MWKFPTMEDSLFKAFTRKINNGEYFAEIVGWENFLKEVIS